MACQSVARLSDAEPSKRYGYAIMSWSGRSISCETFLSLRSGATHSQRGQPGKKNAKAKDTGGVKYIALERETPPAGAKAVICVSPSGRAVSASCQGNVVHHTAPRWTMQGERQWRSSHNNQDFSYTVISERGRERECGGAPTWINPLSIHSFFRVIYQISLIKWN